MQSCSIPAVSSENQQNEGTYAAREQKSVTLRTCTQLQCVADKKGKLIEEGLAPALPPWPGGVYLGTPVADGDIVGQHILLFRHTILDSDGQLLYFVTHSLSY